MAEKYKRLLKSDTDKIIGGVCAGLAHYFNIDPAVVRLIFVVFTLFSGAGLIAYLILWIIMPPKDVEGNVAEIKSTVSNLGNQRGGVILLIVGLVLLMHNLGLFSWVDLSQLWPAALIILGLIIIFRK